MTKYILKKLAYVVPAYVFMLSLAVNLHAQSAPEIPSSVSFGGITVKFDRGAQNLIEEDVRSLMANKKFWEEKMDRAILHFPIVEAIFMDEEVPIDFKYLAVQESSFRPDVISTSNAVGYWQFKPETARELNLRVDSDIDERKNISASTHAAAWYLKKNNQQFNNWVSTLYSYYLGAGGVKKVIPAAWSYAREVTLTSKTDRYMLRFFAHKIALEAGIERYKTPNAYILMESDYGKGKTLDDIGKDLGLAASDVKNYNRWISDGKIPNDREYLVTLPVPNDKVASVREKLALPPKQTAVASVYEETGYPVLQKTSPPSQREDVPARYQVNSLPGIQAVAGSKPKTLAKAGDLSLPKFMRYNDMTADMPLVPGKVYYLARKNKKAATPFHTARPGDTWHSVSQEYGIRLVSLLKYNRTTSRNYPIQTGQVLFLQKKRPRRQPIEIIAPPQPKPVVKDSVIAVVPEKAPAASSGQPNVIPDSPSGRKKYTPVLVEKSESTPAKETKPETPAPVAAASTPVATAPSTTNTPNSEQTNDRVIIITQDNAETSFKSGEEERPVPGRNTPSKVITPNDTRSSAGETSVYAKQRAAREKAEREANANDNTQQSQSNNFHTVVSGDTYFGIAGKYNLSLKELLDLNNRSSQRRLVTGEKLVVGKNSGQATAPTAVAAEQPVAKTSPEKIEVTRSEPATTFKTPEEVKEETRSTATPGSEFHVVQGGQTYYSISKAYGLSIRELLELNGLDDQDRLRSGQRLKVRKDASTAPATQQTIAPASNKTHTVAAGETLFRIAQTYHLSVEDVKRANNMSGNNVMVGQKLKIPAQ